MKIGDRVQLTPQAKTLIGRSNPDRKGTIINYAKRMDCFRVQWDGHKNIRTINECYLEIIPNEPAS